MNARAADKVVQRKVANGLDGKDDTVKQTPAWYMLSHSSGYRLSWDILLFFLLLYVLVMMPLAFAFETEIAKPLATTDIIVDSFFAVDIIGTFFTTAVNRYDELLMTPREVAAL